MSDPKELRGFWGSWYDKTEFRFPVPAGWVVQDARMAGADVLTDEEIVRRLSSPIHGLRRHRRSHPPERDVPDSPAGHR